MFSSQINTVHLWAKKKIVPNLDKDKTFPFNCDFSIDSQVNVVLHKVCD